VANENSSTSVIRGTGIVGSLTLVSRVLGFVRDMLVARLFGSGLFADAFFVAFRIPNLLRSLVAEGALVSAFVPVFATELKSGHAQAQRAFRSVTALLLVSTTLLSGLGIIYSPEIVSFFAPGFKATPEKFELCVLLTRVMLPYIMFVSLIALLNGALNSVKIFGASALAQVVMNLVLIAGAGVAAFMESRPAVLALSVSVIAGGLAQLLAQIPALRRSGFSLVPSGEIFSNTNRRLLSLMLPAVVGATVYQLTIFLNTVMASLLREGSVSWLFYADRLTQLPIGIFSIALASVLLPTLSRAHAENNRDSFSTNLMNSLRYTSFFMIPVSCALGMLALPLVQILFERGKFDYASTMQTTLAVQGYALGLWGMSCHSMVVRAFIAQHDTITSTLVGVLSLVVTFVCSLLLVGVIAPQQGGVAAFIIEAQKLVTGGQPLASLGHVGLALSTSIAATLAFLVLGILLHRRLGGLHWKPFFLSTGKSLLASTALCLTLRFILSRVESPWLLITLSPLGVAAYLFVSFACKSAELEETFGLISRLLKRRRRA
jgi:putative peptidoglycan lipid II flippase